MNGQNQEESRGISQDEMRKQSAPAKGFACRPCEEEGSIDVGHRLCCVRKGLRKKAERGGTHDVDRSRVKEEEVLWKGGGRQKQKPPPNTSVWWAQGQLGEVHGLRAQRKLLSQKRTGHHKQQSALRRPPMGRKGGLSQSGGQTVILRDSECSGQAAKGL
eukprot:2060228-Ditylum_brightwellii.AAC.1